MTTNIKWEPTHDLQLITVHKQELSVRGIAE